VSRMGDYIIAGEEAGTLYYDEEKNVYELTRSVPVPESIKKRQRLGNLPLKDMRPGESFLVECDNEEEQARRIATVRARVHRAKGAMPDAQFSVVREGVNIRVFRVE